MSAPPNVLIVEDDEAIRGLLGAICRQMGLTTTWAADGAEAIRILAEGVRFRAIVLDLMLPGVSGFTVLEHLEDSKNPTPVIVVSAAVYQMRTTTFDPNIVKAVILKPFSLQEFQDALAKATM